MKKVMIIDNNENSIRVLESILTKAGFKVDVIVKPIFAVDLMIETKPNLVLLDVDLPEINGFQLCKQVKRNKLISDIPLIFVSSLSDVKYIAGGLALGAVDYMIKPIKPEELVARVSVHMELGKVRQKLKKSNDVLQSELNMINMEALDAESDFLYTLSQLKYGKASENDIARIRKYLNLNFESLIANSPYRNVFDKNFIIDIIKKYL